MIRMARTKISYFIGYFLTFNKWGSSRWSDPGQILVRSWSGPTLINISILKGDAGKREYHYKRYDTPEKHNQFSNTGYSGRFSPGFGHIIFYLS
jgi:hypothetical protein